MDYYIYGIIKENGVSGLRKVSYKIKNLPNIPISENCSNVTSSWRLWYGINWKFNDDISFLISTNFGYGLSSFFYAIFKYKDLILAPYSFYVKYKNSTFASVTRCTYEYSLNYDSWNSVMTDCLDFYNAIVSKDSKYVFTWLDNQLNEMVSGLESAYKKCLREE